MRLTRFCSQEEFGKFIAGESLTNHTDHYRDTAKLVRVVPPEEFAAYPEEFKLALIFYNIKH